MTKISNNFKLSIESQGFLEFDHLKIEIYPPIVGQVWNLFFGFWNFKIKIS